MSIASRLFRWSFVLLLLTACGEDDEGEPDDSKSPSTKETFDDQVELGLEEYTEHCSECHGGMGQGTDKAPRLVGLEEGALPKTPPATRKVRKDEFVTVADVAKFAVANMPPSDPGSLSTKEYLAILAFDLDANGIELDEPLTLELAADLTIPR